MRLFDYFRYLIFFPTALLSMFSPAYASGESVDYGLKVTVFQKYWDEQYPDISNESTRPIVGETVFSNVDQNFDYEPPFGLYDNYIIKYEGYITSPVSGSIYFWPSGDDGTKILIDGTLVDDNWYIKACCGNRSNQVTFEAGETKKITFWFYEHGGGSWVKLYWNIVDDQITSGETPPWVYPYSDYSVVPSYAFSLSQPTPPTTTTIPETTIPETTVPRNTVPETTIPETTIPEMVTTSTIPTETTIVIPPTTEVPSGTSSTTTTEVKVPEPPKPAETTTTSSPTTTVKAVESVQITESISAEEALSVASDPAIVAELSKDEASSVFAAIDMSSLSESEVLAIVNAVQNAPVEVREAFEEEINIFSGNADTYVPIGSTVPVNTRRIIIGVTSIMTMLPSPTPRRK